MMAKSLATNGAAKVYILGRRLDKLQETVAVAPSIITSIVADVTSKDALNAAAAQIMQETGYINLVCANSGIVGPEVTQPQADSPAKFKEMVMGWDVEKLTAPYTVNVVSVLLTAAAFVELLDAGNKKKNMGDVSSSVVVTASIAGYMRTVVTGFPYITSKAAAIHMTKCLATWFANYGIRVNGLAPGIFPSEMTPELMARFSSADGKVPRAFIPAERFGRDEDLAGTLIYLASKAGAFLSGNVVGKSANS